VELENVAIAKRQRLKVEWC